MAVDLALPDFCDPQMGAHFVQDGWLVAPALDASGREALLALWAEVGPEHSGSYSTTSEGTTSLPLRRRVSEEVIRCLDPFARRLVRSHRVVQGGFIVKRPGARGLIPHRHSAIADEFRHVALLAWVALQDTPVESGCMRVASGTHRVRPMMERLFGTPEEAPETRNVPLAGGEALVMDHRLVHGSRRNRTEQERLAVGILLLPEKEPLWYTRQAGPLLEIYEVPDDFYVRWIPGTPPPLETPPVRRLPLLALGKR